MTLDGPDLDLVAALQHAPRAGVRLLAEVLDSSPSTISRRLNRLTQSRLLRVSGGLNWYALTDVQPQHLWITTRPGTAVRVARDLAALPETQFAALTAGRSDVYCFVQPTSRGANADLITERIGGIPGIVASHTEIVLRAPATSSAWALDRLTPAQRDRLRADNPAPSPIATARLTPEERQVAAELRGDCRLGATEIARRLHLSQSTVHRLIESLLDNGIVVPKVDVEPATLGLPLEVVIRLAVKLNHLTGLADTLASRSSARFVSTVAGTSSLIYYGTFRDEAGLSGFLTEDLGTLDGIQSLETAIVLRVLKRDWLPRHGRPLAE